MRVLVKDDIENAVLVVTAALGRKCNVIDVRTRLEETACTWWSKRRVSTFTLEDHDGCRHRRVVFHDRHKLCEDFSSEEHTSELQSRLHLVCRLLLEKKKKI